MAYFSVVEQLAKQWLHSVQGRQEMARLEFNEPLDSWCVCAGDGWAEYWQMGQTLDDAENALRLALFEAEQAGTIHTEENVIVTKEEAEHSGEYMTIREIAAAMGMKPDSVSNYTSGRAEPALPVAKRQIVRGFAQAMILRTDFTTWRAQYLAKKPFGGALHKNRSVTHESTE